MPQLTVPRFREAGHFVRPDTCEPLRAAADAGKVTLAAAGRGDYPGWRIPEDWVPELRSAGVWDAATEQTWGLDWHRNEGIEITYLERGKLWYEMEGSGQGVWLREGDLTVTRPWQLHRVGNPNVTASRLHWLILDVDVRRPNQEWKWPRWLLYRPAELQKLETLLRQNHESVLRTNGDVRRAFQKLSEHLGQSRQDPHDVWIKLLINQIMVAVGELLLSRDVVLDPALGSSHRTVELFLQELRRRVGEEWTMDLMASECGLNRTRFAHYCKQITNMTPAEYLTSCRVEAAAEMLRSPKAPSITDIAYQCGFGSSQYFATVFRRQTGRTPKEFRASETPAASARAHFPGCRNSFGRQ